MKIIYEIDPTLEEDCIIIKTKELTTNLIELEKILNQLNDSSSSNDSIIAYQEKKIFPIKNELVEKIYSESRKTYIESENISYETKNKLSDFDTFDKKFTRISKSMIINIKYVKSIEVEFSGNFVLTLKSGKKEMLSRNYVKSFKKSIGMEV